MNDINAAQRLRVAAMEKAEAAKARGRQRLGGAPTVCCQRPAQSRPPPSSTPSNRPIPPVKPALTLPHPSRMVKPPPNPPNPQIRVVKEAEADAEAKYLHGSGVARQRQVGGRLVARSLAAGCSCTVRTPAPSLPPGSTPCPAHWPPARRPPPPAHPPPPAPCRPSSRGCARACASSPPAYRASPAATVGAAGGGGLKSAWPWQRRLRSARRPNSAPAIPPHARNPPPLQCSS
jgi:hypothetical protein